MRTQHLVKGVKYKPQPGGTRAPLTPAPSRRRGVRVRREREPRTAKHPALAICTTAHAWVLEIRETGQ